MTWQVSGRSMEMCNCKQFCPCWLGPEGEPDEGWCAGLFGYEVQQGASEGIDLSGTRAAMIAEWPGNFFGGKGTARLYIDESASDEQRRELEEILGGKKESFLSALWGAVIDEWLPTQTAKIDIGCGEKPSVTVDGLGQATLEPVTDGAGNPTVISGAMAQAGIHIESMNLAMPRDGHWNDPGLRDWRPADGELYDFNWSG